MSEMTPFSVNRNYRDTVFRMLFGEDKNNAMSLYEAISGKKIQNPEDFEFTTLKDVIYMKMKNDVSFLVDSRLVLFEHQSTFNPNMPLRGLLYCAELYKTRYHDARLYSSARIDLPAPEYVVFYNGSEKHFPEDRMELKLSDSFADKSLSSKYEWTATMININNGHNNEIIRQCAALEGYSVLIRKIVEYRQEYPVEQAVRLAMDYCIEHDYLKEFLSAHMKEVFNMSLTEFDEKEFIEMIRHEERVEGRAEGRVEGRVEGRAEGRVEGRAEGRVEGRAEERELFTSLIRKLYADGREADVLKISTNESYCDQLMKEYALV